MSVSKFSLIQIKDVSIPIAHKNKSFIAISKYKLKLTKQESE